MTRSRSSTKLTPTVTAMRLAAGSYSSRIRFEQLRIGLVLDEQRAREHVSQEQHDPQDLVGLDAARDDPLRQLPRVRLEVSMLPVSSAST